MSDLINAVDELLERRDLGEIQLTDWEDEFLTSQAAYIELGKRVFTEREADKIKEIHNDKLG